MFEVETFEDFDIKRPNTLIYHCVPELCPTEGQGSGLDWRLKQLVIQGFFFNLTLLAKRRMRWA